MNRFGQYPFVRILLPFLAGILLAIHFDFPDPVTIIILFTLFGIYVIDYYSINFSGNFRVRFVHGVFLNLLLFFTGLFWVSLFDDRKNESHYLNQSQPGEQFLVEIINAPVSKEKSIKAEVHVLACINDEKVIPVTGKAILYFQKNEEAKEINYGDRIFVYAKINPVAEPSNPGEFNFKKYCRYQHIAGSGYVRTTDWKKIAEGGNFIYRSSFGLRSSLLNIFRDSGMEEREFAVASALVLGYSDEIGSETFQSFSGSGTLHVLSVSGLHVAILFLLFDKLFSFLLIFKRGYIIKAVLIVLVLWIYALLTGLSPSVMRAALMLSFVVAGKAINRNASVYNIIAASAFLLLCIDPYNIMQVGFQLSYLAVIGIIYIQPKIYQLFFFKNKVVDFIWNISSVSIAAQLATFPLGLFYFHQFPNYFLLSNLIVIPLGTIILYTGIIALLLSFVPYAGEFLFYLLKWMVWCLNESVAWVEALPYSVSDGLSVTAFQVVLIYFVIIAFLFLWASGKIKSVNYLTFFVTILFISFSIQKFQQTTQRKFIVYNIPRQQTSDFIIGRSNYFLSDSSLLSDSRKLDFHVFPGWASLGISDHHIMVFDSIKDNTEELFFYKNYMAFHDLKIVRISRCTKLFQPKNKLKVNMVIFSGNPEISIDELNNMYEYETLVIDSSNPEYSVEKWKKEGGRKVYVVNEKGAFIRDI